MAPGATPVHLYLTPYLRLYLLAHLADLDKARQNPMARELWEELQKAMGGQLVGVTNDWQERPSQVGRVELWVVLRPDIQLASARCKRIELAQAVVSRRYFAEMYATVDWYRRVLGTKARVALELWRRQYSITEDDYAFASMERTYQKHCNRSGISRKRRRRSVRKAPARTTGPLSA